MKLISCFIKPYKKITPHFLLIPAVLIVVISITSQFFVEEMNINRNKPKYRSDTAFIISQFKPNNNGKYNSIVYIQPKYNSRELYGLSGEAADRTIFELIYPDITSENVSSLNSRVIDDNKRLIFKEKPSVKVNKKVLSTNMEFTNMLIDMEGIMGLRLGDNFINITLPFAATVFLIFWVVITPTLFTTFFATISMVFVSVYPWLGNL